MLVVAPEWGKGIPVAERWTQEGAAAPPGAGPALCVWLHTPLGPHVAMLSLQQLMECCQPFVQAEAQLLVPSTEPAGAEAATGQLRVLLQARMHREATAERQPDGSGAAQVGFLLPFSFSPVLSVRAFASMLRLPCLCHWFIEGVGPTLVHAGAPAGSGGGGGGGDVCLAAAGCQHGQCHRSCHSHALGGVPAVQPGSCPAAAPARIPAWQGDGGEIKAGCVGAAAAASQPSVSCSRRDAAGGGRGGSACPQGSRGG